LNASELREQLPARREPLQNSAGRILFYASIEDDIDKLIRAIGWQQT